MRVLVPVLTGVFVLAAIVWPIVRLWWRNRTFGLVAHRARRPEEVLVGASFATGVGGFAVVASVVAAVPGASLPVPPAVTWVGVAVALLGLGVVVAAQAQMGASWRIGIDDRPTELVERG